MKNKFTRSIYERHLDTPRYWSSRSETYTGVDSLLTALDEGWAITGPIVREDVLFMGARRSMVYTFTLERDGQRESMPVITNPILTRLIRRYQLQSQIAEAVQAIEPEHRGGDVRMA